MPRKLGLLCTAPVLITALIMLVSARGFSENTTEIIEKPMNNEPSSHLEHATFAGGCFWCMQPAFDGIPGVISTAVGYSGGKEAHPTYEMVGSGKTTHREAIEIEFDPAKVSYKELVLEFWRNIDPTQADGQFADRGHEYTTAIFYHSEAQRKVAEQSKTDLEKSGKFDAPIVTQILPASAFYKAEEYHQDYYKKNSSHYNLYKEGSGRGRFIRENWKNEDSKESMKKKDWRETAASCETMSDEDLKAKLSPEQYNITRQNGTERPFHNAYWDNHRDGIYVDIVSGEPLFSSTDKFDSGTGWPSFSKPIDKATVTEHNDQSHGMTRTEVRSKIADSHLGHLFHDGPSPSGNRYCINSGALRFIPVEDLEREGYAEYLKLFKK